jgi:hypothetical protein
MPSPFPGVDPFLEDQVYWPEFHSKYIRGAQESLAERVPDDYEVRLGQRPSLILESDLSEEVVEHRIEIRRFPGRELVTVLELLSPSNKEAPGDRLYAKKRLELIDQAVHLVELDFLLGGKRLEIKEDLPRGHHHAFVSRAERRPLSEVYSWSIRDLLPVIPIPLKAPDADVLPDLAAIFDTVYQRARYERASDYTAPLKLPLSPEDRDWAEGLARAFHPRGAR